MRIKSHSLQVKNVYQTNQAHNVRTDTDNEMLLFFPF